MTSLVEQVQLTPALVAANTTAEQLFNLPAVLANPNPGTPSYAITVNKPTQQAGLGIVGARYIPPVGAGAPQVGITFSNNTAAGITPTAAETYTVGLHWSG